MAALKQQENNSKKMQNFKKMSAVTMDDAIATDAIRSLPRQLSPKAQTGGGGQFAGSPGSGQQRLPHQPHELQRGAGLLGPPRRRRQQRLQRDGHRHCRPLAPGVPKGRWGKS